MLKLIADLGKACAGYHDENVRNVRARHVQCDEIWSFCYGKDKNITADQMADGAGSLWTWTALDADSKLIVSLSLRRQGFKLGNVVYGGCGIASGHSRTDHHRWSQGIR